MKTETTGVTTAEFIEEMAVISAILNKALVAKIDGQREDLLRHLQKARDIMSNLLQSEIHEVKL